MNRPAPLIRGTHILAHHGVHPTHTDGLTVAVGAFRTQMEWIAEQGIRLVTLRAYCEAAARSGGWPRGLMALTFDDGYRDCCQHVLPVLKEFGFTATVFVITDTLVAGKAPPLHCPPHKEFLSLSEMSLLVEAGWEIGSHTCNHARLPGLNESEQARQIAESRRVLEAEMLTEIHSFCYPAGKLNADTVRLVREAGYEIAPVTPWARGLVRDGDWLTLERVGLYRSDTLPRFRLKMSPLFHWLRRGRFLLAPSAA